MTAETKRLRTVWAFVGEYASGKSENAVNAALFLRRQGHAVTLVDLDMVEPCYTLRPLKDRLQQAGLDVVAWQTADTFGLGEAGQTIVPAARWALRRPGDVIFDVGYGVDGSNSLRLVEGALESPELQVVLVLNTSRTMTASKEMMVEYLAEIGRVDAVVANTHLMSETTPEVVREGYRLVESLCRERQLPILYASVSEEFHEKYPDFTLTSQDGQPVEIRVLERWMPDSFW